LLIAQLVEQDIVMLDNDDANNNDNDDDDDDDEDAERLQDSSIAI
jgi:hypothetical protein